MTYKQLPVTAILQPIKWQPILDMRYNSLKDIWSIGPPTLQKAIDTVEYIEDSIPTRLTTIRIIWTS